MKGCIHVKCRKTVTDDLVACREHWLQLSVDIRKGLVRAKAHIKRDGKNVVEVPENKPLMKVCREQALKFWETRDATT